MKLIILSLIVVSLCGCQKINENMISAVRDSKSVITIDNCQYIEVYNNPAGNNAMYSLTHKGNCINPIHTYNKEK